MIGIILTIYFSVYYVPQYSEDIKLKRIENINTSLITIVQELVYNEHEVNEEDLQTLIKGKELKYNIEYPYSLNELLIQTQERFLDNKFIPLQERKNLIEKVDQIRALIEPATIHTESKLVKKAAVDYLSYLISLIGILASGWGAFGIWIKNKHEKEIEAERKVEEKQEEIKFQIKEGVLLENIVEATFKELIPEIKIEKFLSDRGYDFIILIPDGKQIGVEVKFTENSVLKAQQIRPILRVAKEQDIETLLISNAGFSDLAKRNIDRFNKEHTNKITCLTANNIELLRTLLGTYIKDLKLL